MEPLKIKPLGDRVVIKQKEAPKTFGESELMIPDRHQEKHRPAEGTVVAVGPGLLSDNSLLRKILKFLVWAATQWIKLKFSDNAPMIPEEFNTFNSMSVKVGDYVRYGNHAGTKIDHEGQEYVMVREIDIFYVDIV